MTRETQARALLRGALLAAEYGMRVLGEAASRAADTVAGLAVHIKPIDKTRGNDHAEGQ